MKIEIDPLETDPTKPGFINVDDDMINVGGTALVTEDTIKYQNRRGNSIGGLNDNTTYWVISVEDDPTTPDIDESQYIKLAMTEQDAIEGNAIHLSLKDSKDVTVATNNKGFGGADVDAVKNTISLANPAWTNAGTVDFSSLGQTFELGQAVVYHEGSAPIPGLTDGATYCVISAIDQYDLQGNSRFVEKQVIQHAETENESRGGVPIDTGRSARRRPTSCCRPSTCSTPASRRGLAWSRRSTPRTRCPRQPARPRAPRPKTRARPARRT